MEFLDRVVYGNSLKDWMWAAIVMLSVLTVLRVLRTVVARRIAALAARTANRLDDQIAEMMRRTRFFFILILSIYSGALLLDLSSKWEMLVQGALVLAVVLQIGLWLTSLLGIVVSHYVEREIGQGSDAIGATTALTFIGKLLLWVALVLWAFDNIGWKVTTLVAGLGITGIAVALAAQNILGDLFASFSILFDKPFVIGDFIMVDDLMGHVERIGMKTTRIKSLSGEQLVISNADLLKSRIRNFKLLQERRVVFTIGVVYQTAYASLAAIPKMIREIVESQPSVRFDRAHFASYGESALTYEVVYWVTDPDYNTFMDIQQSINLALFRKFEEEGIQFAYPTRTVVIAGGKAEEPSTKGTKRNG